MLGFAGLWNPGQPNAEALGWLVTQMAEQLGHGRVGTPYAWVDGENGVAMGLRRQTPGDRRPSGYQAMPSATGRYVVALNGDDYNLRKLHDQLVRSGRSLRGAADAEVITAALEEWGMAVAVRRFIGAFAVAVWDAQERSLTLIRDRLGVKPLYYGWAKGTFVFSSELKAFLVHPDFSPSVHRGALALYLRHSYVPSPLSIYEGIRKLPPGCFLEIPTGSTPYTARPREYWSALRVAEEGTRDRYEDDDGRLADRLDSLLRTAVRLRMATDVPPGAFLSGGVDSSLVVSLMQAQSTRPVKTFTVGFHDAGFDEAAHAGAVARHLGTEHTVMYVTRTRPWA